MSADHGHGHDDHKPAAKPKAASGGGGHGGGGGVTLTTGIAVIAGALALILICSIWAVWGGTIIMIVLGTIAAILAAVVWLVSVALAVTFYWCTRYGFLPETDDNLTWAVRRTFGVFSAAAFLITAGWTTVFSLFLVGLTVTLACASIGLPII
jgi:hypothetical protein